MKKILILFSIIILVTGCKSDLLDRVPYDEAAAENMWTSEALADQGVIGIYNALRYSKVAEQPYFFEGLGVSGNMVWDYGWNGLLTNKVGISDGLFVNTWKEHYELISRANDAIANLSKAPLSEEKYARLMSESRFLRAYAYYRLNTVFGGVPVYLEPTSVDDFTKPRETQEKVWQVIVDDLTACIDDAHFPGRYDKGKTEYGRATKGAAYALRGKVYLWLKEWAKAESDFKNVGTFGYELFQGNYGELFTEANERCPEMIFSLQCINIVGLGHSASRWYGPRGAFGNCISEVVPNSEFVDTYEWADGTPFSWDDVIPGYSSLTPAERQVYFVRDDLSDADRTKVVANGADMSKYIPNGNEARILQAYTGRDPRLTQTMITPYSTFEGVIGTTSCIYTSRWPYRVDSQTPHDLRTNTPNFLYYIFRKFVGVGTDPYINRDNSPLDLPLIRYADVLLNLAEALNEQDRVGEAIEYVNLVRERAGVAKLINGGTGPTAVNGKDEMKVRIQKERRWELCGEGLTYFDELRWGIYKESKFFAGASVKEIYGKRQNAAFSWNDRVLRWPIPPSEREKNPNLEQNPHW